jgi:hypothetical protein
MSRKTSASMLFPLPISRRNMQINLKATWWGRKVSGLAVWAYYNMPEDRDHEMLWASYQAFFARHGYALYKGSSTNASYFYESVLEPIN